MAASESRQRGERDRPCGHTLLDGENPKLSVRAGKPSYIVGIAGRNHGGIEFQRRRYDERIHCLAGREFGFRQEPASALRDFARKLGD